MKILSRKEDWRELRQREREGKTRATFKKIFLKKKKLFVLHSMRNFNLIEIRIY